MLREPNFMRTWGMHHRMFSSFAAMLAWMPVTGAVVHGCLARGTGRDRYSDSSLECFGFDERASSVHSPQTRRS
jgi:hypothetical protein